MQKYTCNAIQPKGEYQVTRKELQTSVNHILNEAQAKLHLLVILAPDNHKGAIEEAADKVDVLHHDLYDLISS